MNFINQIILEGNVVTDVYYTIVPIPHARVEVLSLRSYRDSDGKTGQDLRRDKGTNTGFKFKVNRRATYP